MVDAKIEFSKVATPLQFTGSNPVLTTKRNEQKYGTKTSAGLHMELAPSAEAS